MQFYNILFFEEYYNIPKWIKYTKFTPKDTTLTTYFNLCLKLAGKKVDKQKFECFKTKMWKQAMKRVNPQWQVVINGRKHEIREKGLKFHEIDEIIIRPQITGMRIPSSASDVYQGGAPPGWTNAKWSKFIKKLDTLEPGQFMNVVTNRVNGSSPNLFSDTRSEATNVCDRRAKRGNLLLNEEYLICAAKDKKEEFDVVIEYIEEHVEKMKREGGTYGKLFNKYTMEEFRFRSHLSTFDFASEN